MNEHEASGTPQDSGQDAVGTVVVPLAGELDLSAVEMVRSAARAALDRSDARRVVLDLAQVGFMDSTVLGALVGLRREAQDARIQLTLRDPQPAVQKLLDITHLNEVFDIERGVSTRIPGTGES